ncbi:response regulator transcription factor [Qipengyuania qiaonensis]|uniref:LuxR C-terminal-related transcriptional regulator n=1 Tax=Qipengyuania qiaonensis TaxID=2867240 RepID=A0ABS7J9A9_9SPHN|nr:LuxR C-terminal-related transcriptional regulator [Qipengyuania qiaonensis]MBX7482459.1 LuxR C-terminal-related transcriptional regulator [Qipengyuania qiaonensis]
MGRKQTIHIVGGTSRCRAEQSHLVFSIGHHGEVYSNITELMQHPPQSGIVLACDEPPQASAVDVLHRLSGKEPWVPVIATSRDPRPFQVVEAIKAGVLDYMGLPLRAERLSQSIDRISSESDNHAEARRRIAEARTRIANLSPREREVLDWLTEGCSNKMIARELGISPRTVEIHRANMMVKLDAEHLAHAVRLFFEARLGDDGDENIRARAS